MAANSGSSWMCQVPNPHLAAELCNIFNVTVPHCAIRGRRQKFLIIRRPAQIIDDAEMSRKTGTRLIRWNLTRMNRNVASKEIR